jgi:hypothetical protein
LCACRLIIADHIELALLARPLLAPAEDKDGNDRKQGAQAQQDPHQLEVAETLQGGEGLGHLPDQ